MKIRTFGYVIKQGVSSTFRNKWFTLASIATIASCLFLFSIVFSVIWNIRSIVKTAEEGVSVTVFFDEGISDERIAEIGNLINGHTAVARADYISADEAWESFKAEYLGEYSDGFTENPLADSENYEIYLNDVSRQGELVQFLEGLDGVRRVNRSEVTANMLTGFNSLIAYVSLAIIAILLLVSIFLISNTVTIGISVRSEEIAIMKYVGATDFFVRSPFVIEGILIGIVGAMIPAGTVYLLYGKVISYIMERYDAIFSVLKLLPVNEVFQYLLPVCIAVGVGIGFFGSYFTVRRHLRV